MYTLYMYVIAHVKRHPTKIASSSEIASSSDFCRMTDTVSTGFMSKYVQRLKLSICFNILYNVYMETVISDDVYVILLTDGYNAHIEMGPYD